MGKNGKKDMADLSGNIALVYDRVNKWGGAESVLLALHELFPNAPLFTLVYSPTNASWAKIFPQVIPSFLQNFLPARNHHELFAWLSPLAFESFRFNDFSAVISLSSADAKGIITGPSTFHLNYCLTPTRYLWSHQDLYLNQLPYPLKKLASSYFSHLRRWDLAASSRPDSVISISQTVQKRVSKYYSRSSTVVYPPVDVSSLPTQSSSSYFLLLGRLVPYKRPDVVIQAFNQLKIPLVVAGSGSMFHQLKTIAGPHISFTGFVSPASKQRLLSQCAGLVFFHEEDFGIVPLEAMAYGKPVLALNQGGASETVVPGVTGLLTDDASVQGLINLIEKFPSCHFDSKTIKKHAQNFSKSRFKKEFAKIFSTEWQKYKNIYTY